MKSAMLISRKSWVEIWRTGLPAPFHFQVCGTAPSGAFYLAEVRTLREAQRFQREWLSYRH